MPKFSYTHLFLKRLLIWGGPITITLLMIVSGFGYWVFTSSAGARWALVSAVRFIDGDVSGVSGTFWQGLKIGKLNITTEDIAIETKDFYLKINWQQLLNRHIQIEELSTSNLSLNLISSDTDDNKDKNTDLKDLENIHIPELPVSLAIRKLALDQIQISSNHELMDFNARKIDLNLQLSNDGAHAQINNIDINYFQNLIKNSSINTKISGDIDLEQINAPWGFVIKLTLMSKSLNNDLLCARSYLDTLPVTDNNHDNPCEIAGFLNAKGSISNVVLETMLHGQNMKLFANTSVKPLQTMPLENAILELTLADQSSLLAQFNLTSNPEQHDINANIKTTNLNVAALLGNVTPKFILETESKLRAKLDNSFMPLGVELDADLKPNTKWNEQDLNGKITTNLDFVKQTLEQINIDISLGDNKITTLGSFGATDSSLKLDLNAPKLHQLLPEITGGIKLNTVLNGSIDSHTLNLETEYTPENLEIGKVGLDRAQAQLNLSGSLINNNQWHGNFSNIKLNHAGLGLANTSDIPVDISLDSPDDFWSVGAGNIDLYLHEKPILSLQHNLSNGNEQGHWHTSGKIAQIAITQELINNVEDLLDLVKPIDSNQRIKNRGGIKVLNVRHHDETDLVLGLDWNLQLNDALSGKIAMQRLSGDVMIPGDEPIPLGLNQLDLDINISEASGGTSNINTVFKSNTNTMGGTQINANTVIHKTDSGLIINPSDTINAHINANIDDLAWLSIFAGDDLQFGGHIDANINATATIKGDWSAKGNINGKDLRIVRIDDGMRLMDGRLIASLDGNTLNLNELHFPASLRVIPKHERLANWLQNDQESQGGFLKLSGKFNLSDMLGNIVAEIDKFPVVQRSDRFAMLSGNIDIDAAMDALDISGRITADAGWVNIDMLSGIDGVDSDVIVVYDDEPIPEITNPMNISVSVIVNLGERLYLTGFGLNSGLTGGMRITLQDNKLSGLGSIRTRGGSVQAYGQRLQIRRGTITFQGDINNPLLDIEALRTGLAVEAGVKVAGTAKKPRINLVSYPEVSEVEKLSWLLFGHGPDEAGGDMALLVSVGTSFLGDGEPFYRKFGIDEVALQAGEVGSVGSILPVESVVSGLARDTSELENQFIAISKNVSWGFTVGLQQALSDTGTVARVSYRLMRGLTAELSVGTNNGLALIYRWFSK